MSGKRTEKNRSFLARASEPSCSASDSDEDENPESPDIDDLESAARDSEFSGSLSTGSPLGRTDEDGPLVPPALKPIAVGRPTVVFEPKPIESEFRSIPYRPDTVIDGWSSDLFTVRAASLRGYLHRYNGTPRQDDFALLLRANGRQLLVAVADGVSGAKQSHIGSTTAVRYAVQWLDANLPDDADDCDWGALAENTAWALVEQASALFEIDKNAEEAEQLVATTLVCAVIGFHEGGEATAHLVGIGDSGAWILSSGSYRTVEGGKKESDSGMASSAVSGLPRVPDELGAVRVTIESDEVLLLATDGVGDPLGPGTGDLGGLFNSMLTDGIPTMAAFAYTLDFSRETFDDDRTLVAVWPSPRANYPSP